MRPAKPLQAHRTGLVWKQASTLFLTFCKYKENKKNNTRILDTLFIDDFTDIMEQS